MEFTQQQLDEIILLGATGKDLYSISMGMGITPDRLDDLRKVDERLNDALNRADKNYKLFKKSELEKSLKNLKSPIAKEFYTRLLDESKPTDNEIIIRDY